MQFLARVAGNTLDIVLREFASGSNHRTRETERLRKLPTAEGNVAELRWRLVAALRGGKIPLEAPGLSATC